MLCLCASLSLFCSISATPSWLSLTLLCSLSHSLSFCFFSSLSLSFCLFSPSPSLFHDFRGAGALYLWGTLLLPLSLLLYPSFFQPLSWSRLLFSTNVIHTSLSVPFSLYFNYALPRSPQHSSEKMCFSTSLSSSLVSSHRSLKLCLISPLDIHLSLSHAFFFNLFFLSIDFFILIFVSATELCSLLALSRISLTVSW